MASKPARGTVRLARDVYEVARAQRPRAKLGWARDLRPADLKKALLIAALYVVAWGVPPRWWPAVNAWRARVATVLSRRKARDDASRLPPELFSRVGADSRLAAWRSVRAAQYVDPLLILRARRPGGWEPHVRLFGGELIDQATEEGRGVILWVTPSAGSTLATKLALSRSNHPAVHLSRPAHGFSYTPFGIRRFNPIWTGVESRYLAERVVLDPERPTPAMQRLLRALKRNRVVTITVSDHASTTEDVPFLGGWLSLPLGPARLSRLSGAPILPVFTTRLAPDRYDVHVERRLQAGADADPNGAIDGLLADYLDVLRPRVEADPASWQGWWQLRSRGDAPAA